MIRTNIVRVKSPLLPLSSSLPPSPNSLGQHPTPPQRRREREGGFHYFLLVSRPSSSFSFTRKKEEVFLLAAHSGRRRKRRRREGLSFPFQGQGGKRRKKEPWIFCLFQQLLKKKSSFPPRSFVREIHRKLGGATIFRIWFFSLPHLI